MSDGFTRGPWSCEHGADGYYAVYQGDEPVIGNVAANEALISAAPDLLEALIAALIEMEAFCGAASLGEIAKAKRAIAKATSQSGAA